MNPFISVRDAVKVFGISKNSLYRLIAERKIQKYWVPPIKRRTFLLQEEIIAQFKPVDQEEVISQHETAE